MVNVTGGLVVGVVGGSGVVVGVGLEGSKQQSSDESKLRKVVLSQPFVTHTRPPKQSLSLSQSPWPSPH